MPLDTAILRELGRLGATITAGIAHAATRAASRQQIAREQTMRIGHCLGLTHEHTAQVIDAWAAQARATGHDIDWQQISHALVRRSQRGVWWPPLSQLADTHGTIGDDAMTGRDGA